MNEEVGGKKNETRTNLPFTEYYSFNHCFTGLLSEKTLKQVNRPQQLAKHLYHALSESSGCLPLLNTK